MKNINKIIQGDTIEEMKKLDANSFDFCFADPPYFLQLKKNKKLYRVEGNEFDGCDDDWDQFESMNEYEEFTFQWLSEVKRLLKPSGTTAVISSMQSIFEIGSILRKLGFWVINDVIWLKSNPTPNFSGSRLNNSHETIIIAVKNKNSSFTFNYKTGKHLNDGKQMGSVWKFPVCSGLERLKDKNGVKLHSTQKPEALLNQLIVLFTKENDLIIDPFGGTMTTAAVALKTGRNFVTIEREKKYVEYGKERLKNIKPNIGDIEKAIFDKKESKVTMKEMIDDGFFKLEETFFNKNNDQHATLINDKGQLKYGEITDSMHVVAGLMNNKKIRLNAFDYLMVQRSGKMVSIDEIRKNYRKKIELDKQK